MRSKRKRVKPAPPVYHFVLNKLQPWSAIEVQTTPPMRLTQFGPPPCRGFLPVYDSIAELQKHHGADAPYSIVEEIPK